MRSRDLGVFPHKAIQCVSFRRAARCASCSRIIQHAIGYTGFAHETLPGIFLLGLFQLAQGACCWATSSESGAGLGSAVPFDTIWSNAATSFSVLSAMTLGMRQASWQASSETPWLRKVATASWSQHYAVAGFEIYIPGFPFWDFVCDTETVP